MGVSESFKLASHIPLWTRDLRQAISRSDSQTRKRERTADPIGTFGAPNHPRSLALSFNTPLWVNEPVCFGPRNEPVAKLACGWSPAWPVAAAARNAFA